MSSGSHDYTHHIHTHSTYTHTPPPPFQISKHAISAYLKQNTVPDLTTQLLHSRRGSKPQWKEGSFCLRALGIYAITESEVYGYSTGYNLVELQTQWGYNEY